jgi:hypothetical protein
MARIDTLTDPQHGDIILRPRSPISFDTANIPGLDLWLVRHGWQPYPGRIATEYSRLKHGGQLVVLFNSGSVLVQGTDVEKTMQQLAPLVKGGQL